MRERTANVAERRDEDRRSAIRGGRRRGDRGRPWWQTGIAFAMVCAVLRCWRFFRPAARLDLR